MVGTLRFAHPTIYDFVRCELICSSRKYNLRQRPATNQPDGQITKNLSSPSRKKFRFPFHPNQRLFPRCPVSTGGGSRVVTNAERDAVDAGSVRREACLQGGYP